MPIDPQNQLPAALSGVQNWQKSLGQALRTARDLVQFGLIKSEEAAALQPVLEKYQFLLPRYYAGLIDKDDPRCPIRLQALPLLEELAAFGSGDPLGDFKHRPVDRITHRYKNRALLHLTPNCSMYCRFCFRKTLLNESADTFFEGGLAPALDYLRHHGEIEEVILSGGDPLMVSDANLAWTLKQLAAIPHLQRIRIHSRVPVTFPERVTAELMKAFAVEKPVVLVTHFNHPKELTAEALGACDALTNAGVRLLNQSVLLKNVNDDASTLKTLCEKLFAHGIQPYYLHHPDQAAGTAHFQLTHEEGKQIYETFRKSTSGYLVPRYVVDEGDAHYKSDV